MDDTKELYISVVLRTWDMNWAVARAPKTNEDIYQNNCWSVADGSSMFVDERLMDGLY